MRILMANDGFGDAGGVQSYLDAVASGLLGRGHDVAFLHRDATPGPSAAPATCALTQFSIAHAGLDAALDAVTAWAPDVCFSHNMDRLDVDERLTARWPVIKFMHGYLGTCIGGQKRFGFPVVQPCDRVFGPACTALYAIRHCGQLGASTLATQYRWAREQRALFDRYTAIVVASGHMQREFVRNGADNARIHVNPLFPTHLHTGEPVHTVDASRLSVAFLGRMTVLKGGDLLVRAVARASRLLGQSIALVMLGDGPQRARWQALAERLGVDATFPGWIHGDQRWDWVRRASVLALPSTWPEPFGLVGLEAGALGVPAIAFGVGGIGEWLRDGENGVIVSANPPRARAFAAALADLLQRPADLAAMRIRAAAIARDMSLDRHLDRLERIFRRAARTDRLAAAAGAIG